MRTCTNFVLLLLAFSSLEAQQSEQDYPETISIDLLENIFEAVEFNHGNHARMVDMGEGCVVCHHYAEDDDYTVCAECHLDDPDEATLEEPTINGAYHRSCLACHREWSNEGLCETCHIQKKFRFNKRRTLDKTDIFSVKHSHIGSPEIVTFETPEEKKTMVTFHHEEHIKLYRYACVDCHQSENCATCHDYQGPVEIVNKALTEHHEPCQSCHETEEPDDQCGFCHQNTPSPGFSHELTGWSLKAYHTENSCCDCHGEQEPVQTLGTDCATCHDNFELGLYDHARTGLQLSEDHLDIDCYECHLDESYADPPDCYECHDDEFSFPENLPGEYLKNK